MLALLLLACMAPTARGMALPSRRRLLLRTLGGGAAAVAAAPAVAYPNAVPQAAQYADRKKRRGPAPTDLGVASRGGSDSEDPELKLCGAAPNCFSTTPDSFSDEHAIPTWTPPAKASRAAAVEDVAAAIAGYAPGQSGVDGGGFEVQGKATGGGYFYVRYESLKNGYIDDVEFAVGDAAPFPVRVRSASRVGYLDYEVNAKRLNALSAELRARGWAAPEITAKTHPGYFAQNAAR